MAYINHLLTIGGLYLILSISLDVLVGYTGLLCLAQGAFFGFGAYATAILTRSGFSPLIALGCGMTFAIATSVLIALPSGRIRGIQLLIITIAVQIITTVVLLNWSDLTGGPGGIANIPPLSIAGVPIKGIAFLLTVAIVATIAFTITYRLMRTPYGRLLQAIRDDEVGCLMLGKNVLQAKISAFAFSGALAALAGSLYAHYTSYVDPGSFDILVSIAVLLMVMAGGAGTLYGPAIAALALTFLPELLRFLPAPPGVAAAARQLIFGLLLVLVIFFRPQGLFGTARGRSHGH